MRPVTARAVGEAAPEPGRVEAWLRHLQEDEGARTRLFRLLWYVSTATTLAGFVIILVLLRRQGIL